MDIRRFYVIDEIYPKSKLTSAVFYVENIGNVVASVFSILYCVYLICQFERANFRNQIHVILHWLCFGDVLCNLFILFKYSHGINMFIRFKMGVGNGSVSRNYKIWIYFLYHINTYLIHVFSTAILFHSLILCVNLFLMILLNKEIYNFISVTMVNWFFIGSYIIYALLNIPFALEFSVNLGDRIIRNGTGVVQYPLVEYSTISHTNWYQVTSFFLVATLYIIPSILVVSINFVSYGIARKHHSELFEKFNNGRQPDSEDDVGAISTIDLRNNAKGNGTFSNSRMRKLKLYMLMSISLAFLHLICLGPKVVALIIEHTLVHKSAHLLAPEWVLSLVSITDILENIDSIPNFVLHFYSEKIFEAMLVEKRVKKNWNHVHQNVNLRLILKKG